jgi:ABC-type dipeptide/oligopeptide/nickel transport system ATPase subunit
VESPEFYGIVDKDSIEYRNYQTMVAMINEHYAKYGEPLNEEEERVGFSGKSGGIMDILDINSDKLIQILNTAIKNVPAYKGKNHEGAVLIWGAPGIGKSTIPSAVIKAWNERNDENNQKALMVVECGDLAVDGFSLPMPITKKIGEYLDERPKVNRKLKDFAGSMSEEELIKALDEEIKVSGEAVKTWLPVYKLSSNQKMNKIQNSIANGHIFTDYKFDDTTGEWDTVVTETTEGGIILFDEFFRANEQIFKILMQILLKRRFNTDYQLGDKWAIIACSNRPLDDDEVEKGYSATGAVVGTRFSKQYNFIPNFDEWKKWAVKYGYFDAIFRTKKFRDIENKMDEEVRDILDTFNLLDKANEKAGNLSYGEQRRLEIARALATNPKLLLLDEPAAGMNPQETTQLSELIKNIRDKFNISILLIEHDMKLVMGICDRISVLDYGKKIAEGIPDDIKRNKRVIEAYLGA